MKRRNFLSGALTAGTVAITNQASGQTRFLTTAEFIKLRFCPSKKIHIRRDVNSLIAQDPNHPILESYRKGVAAMKKLPDSDCRSWAYQANIHGTTLPIAQWPPNAPFSTCEHGISHFLPWHRMYLYFFERIVRRMSEDLDFALPYWDYTQSGQKALPSAFRSPANSNNPLYDSTRSSSVNGGSALSNSATSATNALSKTDFLGSSGFSSSVSGTPHGAVHIAVGGNMTQFETAGRDPIFWLHHCNIDRLWEKWLEQGGGRANPIMDSAWMNKTSEFADECCNIITMVNSDVLDTMAQLDHRYEGINGCIPLLVAEINPNRFVATRFAQIEEWFLANAVNIDMFTDGPLRVAPTIKGEEDLSRMLRKNGFLEKRNLRVLLHFERLLVNVPLGGYFEVFVSRKGEDKKTGGQGIYVGNVNTFGADLASQRSMMRAPKMREREHEMGVSTTLDITQAVRELFRSFDFDRDELVFDLRPTTGVEEKGDEPVRLNEKAEPRFEAIRIEVIDVEE